MIGRNRVVITGIGVLAANGIGKDAFWNSLLAGESGIGAITRCDVENLSSQIAGEVKDFNVNDYTPLKIKAKRLSRNTQLAVAAAFLSLKDARSSPIRWQASSRPPGRESRYPTTASSGQPKTDTLEQLRRSFAE